MSIADVFLLTNSLVVALDREVDHLEEVIGIPLPRDTAST